MLLWKYLKSHLLCLNDKIKLYKTLIRSVLTYASEILVLTKTDENMISTFERKILRAIFEPVNSDGE